MNGWIIAILFVVAIVIILFFYIRFLKRKAQNTLIDMGTEIITKTTENILDEKTASQVSKITDATAKMLKSGKKADIIAFVAKKGLEAVKHNNEDNSSKEQKC